MSSNPSPLPLEATVSRRAVARENTANLRWAILGAGVALLLIAGAWPLLRASARPGSDSAPAPAASLPFQPSGVTRKGVDVSKYSGPIPEAKWQRLHGAGWNFAVVGTWGSYGVNPLAQEQLAGARRAGLDTAAYVLLHFNDPAKSGAWQIQRGLEAAGSEARHLHFVALDVEGKGGPLKVDVVQCIREAVQALEAAGIRPVIYASRRDWTQMTGDSREFAHLPLWAARFDGVPELNTDEGRPWVPFGGWTAQAAKQHKGSTDLLGIHADLNISDAALWRGG